MKKSEFADILAFSIVIAMYLVMLLVFFQVYFSPDHVAKIQFDANRYNEASPELVIVFFPILWFGYRIMALNWSKSK